MTDLPKANKSVTSTPKSSAEIEAAGDVLLYRAGHRLRRAGIASQRRLDRANQFLESRVGIRRNLRV